MGVLVALSGWMAALALLTRARARAELVARACHELRSPLTAARLALESDRGAGVVELQLRRAGHAVDELCAARAGGGGTWRPGGGGARSTSCAPRGGGGGPRSWWSRSRSASCWTPCGPRGR